MADYPEHEKLAAIKDQSQAIGEFIDWCTSTHGVSLAEWEPAQVRTTRGHFGHRRIERRMHPTTHRLANLLAEFFGIDNQKLEAEKRAMLDEMRRLNERSA